MRMITTENPGMTAQGFKKVNEADVSALLIPILESRLPKSCNIYNMALRHPRFLEEMNFYTSNILSYLKSAQDTCWIVATYAREDYGLDINISGPLDLFGINELKDTFISSNIIDWGKPFIFAAIDGQLFSVVNETISEATGGKQSKSCRNNMYYITPNEGQHFFDNIVLSNVEIKPMEPLEGSVFLKDNWKFSKDGTLPYVHKLIQRNGSSGVFVEGKLVSGVGMNGSGMLTMLHTLYEYRHHGYGQMVMKYFIKILSAQNNIVPCCTVESSNAPSIALQQKIGLKFSHEVWYFNKPE